MHLQLGSWRDRHRLIARAAAAALLLLAACARSNDAGPRLTIHWTPAPAAGRESVAEIQLTEDGDRPLPGARLRLDAFMTHPGMAPVAAAVDEQGSGRYRARVTFTMAGDWVVRLQGLRPDGRSIDVQEDVRSVRPAE